MESPMSAEPTSNRKPSAWVLKKRKRAKNEILNAANSIMRKSGVESVTLASVADELGMTKQALYHYFSSKEALMGALIASLLEEEVTALLSAVEHADSDQAILDVLIRAFYEHYSGNLDAFRTVYCQSQVYGAHALGLGEQIVRDEINPSTHRLFDCLETRMSNHGAKAPERKRLRQLAFVAWTSALGLLTMLSVADAADDPLIHSDADLLDTLARVFGAAQAGPA
jgi:AcrR family transcriptional regulator